jgi:hypothetical protein
MKSVTWKPGTIKELDDEFDHLRSIQYSNKNHRLWENYDSAHFKDAVALTLCWNDEGVAEICSSIASRKCCPKNTYRILNRLWKHSNKVKFPKIMSPSFANVAASQISWLQQNTDCQLYFISRQTENWEDWTIKNFEEIYNLSFKTDNYKYLTCSLETEPTCWQKIIFNGDESVLRSWKRIAC